MERQATRVYGLLIALLAVVGLFVSHGHMFNVMNADGFLDGLRVVLAVALLYAGFATNNVKLMRSLLGAVAASYVGLAVLGLIDSKLWGLLPNGLTGFDIVFHLVTGVAAGVVAMRKPATETR